MLNRIKVYIGLGIHISVINWIQMCNVLEELDHNSDHMLIGIVLDLTI